MCLGLFAALPMLRSVAYPAELRVKKELSNHSKQFLSTTDVGIEFENFVDEEFDEEFDDDDLDHFNTFHVSNDFISLVPIYQDQSIKFWRDYKPWYPNDLFLRNRNLRL